MRFSTRVSPKLAILLAVLAAVGGFVIVSRAGDPAAPSPRPAAKSAAKPSAGPATPQQAAAPGATLPERAGLSETQSPLFSSQSWEPPPPPVVVQPPAPPPKPVAPPLPYTFAGRMLQDGQVYVFLARGDSVVTAKQGDVIDGVYRVDGVTESEVALTYVPLNQKQSLTVASSLPRAISPPGPAIAAAGKPPSAPVASAAPQPAPGIAAGIPASSVLHRSAPAKLEWGGPQNVKLGTRFDVSLRVKSDEMLHAWPMQLKFDPSVFDVITVKPGQASTGGAPSFDYRVNENGVIEIGAAVQNGTRAANAELVVLTLVPLKAASTTELSVASLSLQGASGRPIAHDRIAAFKTSITP